MFVLIRKLFNPKIRNNIIDSESFFISDFQEIQTYRQLDEKHKMP